MTRNLKGGSKECLVKCNTSKKNKQKGKKVNQQNIDERIIKFSADRVGLQRQVQLTKSSFSKYLKMDPISDLHETGQELCDECFIYFFMVKLPKVAWTP